MPLVGGKRSEELRGSTGPPDLDRLDPVDLSEAEMHSGIVAGLIAVGSLRLSGLIRPAFNQSHDGSGNVMPRAVDDPKPDPAPALSGEISKEAWPSSVGDYENVDVAVVVVVGEGRGAAVETGLPAEGGVGREKLEPTLRQAPVEMVGFGELTLAGGPRVIPTRPLAT